MILNKTTNADENARIVEAARKIGETIDRNKAMKSRNKRLNKLADTVMQCLLCSGQIDPPDILARKVYDYADSMLIEQEKREEAMIPITQSEVEADISRKRIEAGNRVTADIAKLEAEMMGEDKNDE